jgi:ABC-type transport system substrate-binding protein
MPFNAAAVVANSRRWQSSLAGRRLLPHLFAVDAPRPDEVRFLLDRPVPDLVTRLSSPRLAIVSPLALDPQGGRDARFLADATGSGSGAFQLGPRGPARLSLSRYTGWWGSSLGLGPSLDGVSFVVAPQPGQRLRLLKEGTVQVADPLGAPGLGAADADPLLESVGGPPTGLGLEGSVRGIDSATTIPVLSGVWLTRLTG